MNKSDFEYNNRGCDGIGIFFMNTNDDHIIARYNVMNIDNVTRTPL